MGGGVDQSERAKTGAAASPAINDCGACRNSEPRRKRRTPPGRVGCPRGQMAERGARDEPSSEGSAAPTPARGGGRRGAGWASGSVRPLGTPKPPRRLPRAKRGLDLKPAKMFRYMQENPAKQGVCGSDDSEHAAAISGERCSLLVLAISFIAATCCESYTVNPRWFMA